MADTEKASAPPPAYDQAAGAGYGGAAYSGYPPQQGYAPQQAYPPQQGYAPQAYPATGYQDTGAGAGYYAGDTYNDENDLIRHGRTGFSDAVIRRGFIRKVYFLLFAQFAVTSCFVMIFCFNKAAKEWCQTPTAAALMWANFAILIVTEITLICCDGVRRKHPINLIVLGIFTLSMSFFVGIIASIYEPQAVFTAAGATALIVLALTAFSFQTKFDFTGAGPYLFVVFMCFIIFGFFAAIFRSNIANIVYACLGVLIFSCYLVYDTQLLVGGKKYELSEEEYVFAALTIYIDVIQIFLYLLELFGRR